MFASNISVIQPGVFLNPGIIGGTAVFDVGAGDTFASSTIDLSTAQLSYVSAQRFAKVAGKLSDAAEAFYEDVTVAFGGQIPALLAYEFVTRTVPEAMNVIMSVNLDGSVSSGALEAPAPNVVCREVGLPRPRPSCLMFHSRSYAKDDIVQPGICLAWPVPADPKCRIFF